MKVILLLSLCLLSLGAARSDIRGRIMTAAGRPISGATAYVYTAGVKTGNSPYCPSCYVDCGKTAVSDHDGEFRIHSLDTELRFHVLLIAEGFKPKLTEWIDPAKPDAIEVKLEEVPATLDPARMVKGRVVDPHGDALVGAIVAVQGSWGLDPRQRIRSSIADADPMTITNARGEFTILTGNPHVALDLLAEARGFATTRFAKVPMGATAVNLQLTNGATVTGRFLKDGKPVAGAPVGLVQKDRTMEVFTGARTIGTDAEGRFTFSNVGLGGEWAVYGLMSGAKEFGSVQSMTIVVKGDDTRTDVGDFAETDSHTMSGRIVLADGKAVPKDTRLLVARKGAWDAQIVTVDEAGHFSVSGLPSEIVELSLNLANYRFAKSNPNLDLTENRLEGAVDGDVSGLTILLEPGLLVYPTREQMMARFRARGNNLNAEPFRSVSLPQ